MVLECSEESNCRWVLHDSLSIDPAPKINPHPPPPSKEKRSLMHLSPVPKFYQGQLNSLLCRRISSVL